MCTGGDRTPRTTHRSHRHHAMHHMIYGSRRPLLYPVYIYNSRPSELISTVRTESPSYIRTYHLGPSTPSTPTLQHIMSRPHAQRCHLCQRPAVAPGLIFVYSRQYNTLIAHESQVYPLCHLRTLDSHLLI
jgi:hypothetical protein